MIFQRRGKYASIFWKIFTRKFVTRNVLSCSHFVTFSKQVIFHNQSCNSLRENLEKCENVITSIVLLNQRKVRDPPQLSQPLVPPSGWLSTNGLLWICNHDSFSKEKRQKPHTHCTVVWRNTIFIQRKTHLSKQSVKWCVNGVKGVTFSDANCPTAPSLQLFKLWQL